MLDIQDALVYVIDDDESMRDTLEALYLGIGYRVKLFSGPLEALEALESAASLASSSCDLVVSDLRMPEMSGLELLDRINGLASPPPVILLTAFGSVETAIEGLNKGAYDYVAKPIHFDELSVISKRAIRMSRLESSYQKIKKELQGSWTFEDLVGKGPAIQQVFEFIRRVSPVCCNVLITGESGTGKEMVARAIHARSLRAKEAFVAINCTAIPENLLESELFGHTKGAFTGATERRRGLLEEANHGTLFLDEIGDMPLALQAKLLRFIQDRKIKAIGENVYRQVDVRLIAATHQDLKAAIQGKTFREDLFYRLCVAPIELPPLRRRREDIPLLADHFLAGYKRRTKAPILGFTPAAQAKLMRLSWPGNVRELENAVERAAIFCDSYRIDEKDIVVSETADPVSAGPGLFSGLHPLKHLEREYIEYVLAHTGHKREKAAAILGIDRKTLYRKEREAKPAS